MPVNIPNSSSPPPPLSAPMAEAHHQLPHSAHLLGSKVTSHSIKRTPSFLRSIYLEIVNHIEKAKRTVVICNLIARGGGSSINISLQFSGIFYRLNHITTRQIIKK